MRDLIVLAGAPDAAHAGLVDAPPDRLEQLQHQASGLGLLEPSRTLADLVTAALSESQGRHRASAAARSARPRGCCCRPPTPARAAPWPASTGSSARSRRSGGLVLGAGGAARVPVAAVPVPDAAVVPDA